LLLFPLKKPYCSNSFIFCVAFEAETKIETRSNLSISEKERREKERREKERREKERREKERGGREGEH
jgi:hypothetical protein